MEGEDLSCCRLEKLSLFQSGWAVVSSIYLPLFNLQGGVEHTSFILLHILEYVNSKMNKCSPFSFMFGWVFIFRVGWIKCTVYYLYWSVKVVSLPGEEPRSQSRVRLTQTCPTEIQLVLGFLQIRGWCRHYAQHIRHRHRVGVTSWSAYQIDLSVMKNDHLRSASMRDVPD